MPSCLAFECSSTTGKVREKKSFHKIPNPKKEKARASQWIHNMGNAKIEVNKFEASKDKVCCSDHFHKNCFKRNFMSELMPNHSKKLSTDLVDGAIPTIFKHKVYDVINMDGTSMPPLKESASRKRTLENERAQVINNIVLKIN